MLEIRPAPSAFVCTDPGRSGRYRTLVVHADASRVFSRHAGRLARRDRGGVIGTSQKREGRDSYFILYTFEKF